MNFKTPLLAILSVALTMGSTQAKDLSVQGTITPAACEVSVPAGEDIDLGDMPVRESNGGFGFWGQTNTTIRIECSSRMNAALTFRDLTLSENLGPKASFLVVDEKDEPKGLVRMKFHKAEADGESVYVGMRRPSAEGYDYAIADDPGNYLKIGGAEAGGNRLVSIPVRIELTADGLTAFDLKDVRDLRSQLGIDLHYP